MTAINYDFFVFDLLSVSKMGSCYQWTIRYYQFSYLFLVLFTTGLICYSFWYQMCPAKVTLFGIWYNDSSRSLLNLRIIITLGFLPFSICYLVWWRRCTYSIIVRSATEFNGKHQLWDSDGCADHLEVKFFIFKHDIKFSE